MSSPELPPQTIINKLVGSIFFFSAMRALPPIPPTTIASGKALFQKERAEEKSVNLQTSLFSTLFVLN